MELDRQREQLASRWGRERDATATVWRRNELWGHRWLRFWQSRLGEWAAAVAGTGLGPVAAELEPPEPAPPVPPPGAEHAAALPSGRAGFQEVVERTQTCARRVRQHLAASSATRARAGRTPAAEEIALEQTLERQLAVLEALLEKFRSAGAATDGAGSLAADLEAAREVCEAAEALMEGWERRG
jgi:hypothetical protein